MEARVRHMENPFLQARLESAKRKAKLGQSQIDRQQLVVANLFAEGAQIDEAENRLHIYQRLHDRYVADMERILFALETNRPD